MGQIKVLHRCHPEQMQQCVYLQDLEKHVENKCQGFDVECFACLKRIKTLKGIKRHIKYECPQIKINCYLCGNWLTRADFKNQELHQCHFDLL